MQTFVFILEILGTVAFAASGAMTALKKDMDLFGVIILGIVTAVGGGAIRDIILGKTPPTMFEKPLYALIATAVSLIIFFPTIRRMFHKNQVLYDNVIRIMDSLGLAIFTVMGINTAENLQGEYNIFLLVFVGVITGVGGGVIRDVLAGNTPYIFVKHIYASASIAGALACILLWEPLGAVLAMFIGASLVFVIRLLAAHFKWSLPHAKEN
ncbi:MAG: trimeric intracellular cation channel family protein [Clostridia bacterium]|nr:trimeric intracellular cation channel family protein [Clostridia bacterium]